MTTIVQLRSLVRQITTIDSSADLPDSLIDTYAKDGFQRMLNLERRWPFLEVKYSMNTVANTREYLISSISTGNLREITSVVDTSVAGNRLHLIGTDEGERIWNGTLDVASRPLYYAEWADTLSLYPKPNAVYPLTIRGYRKPSYTWLTVLAQEIDCDERLHFAVVYYVVSQVYKRQEDAELSQMYETSFNSAVALAHEELMRSPSSRPMILSGGNVRGYNYNYWLQQLGRTL